MHSTAAFLSMPNKEGIVLGGPPGQGFNDNSARGYPAWMTITTRQVTDVVMNDQNILAVKGGRQVSATEPYLSDVDRQERIRQVCASKYLGGYSEAKVLDPVQLLYPACTMPLAATTPDTDQTSAMHPALVTELALSKPYYRLGGLIPHLTREGFFWKSTRSAVHETILEYQLSLDPEDTARLKQMDVILCGWVPSLQKVNDYNPTTGLHKTLTD